MAKETEFDHPPRGHIAPLIFDSVAKKWYAIKGSGYDYLQVEVQSSDLPDGAATEAKQLPDGHNVTVDNASIAVTGAFYPVTQPISEAAPPVRDVQLYGWDGDSWEKIKVDNSGYLKVGLPYDETMSAHLYQYDGSNWRKSNLLWGFYDTYSEFETHTLIADEDRTLTFSTVPEGEVWVVTYITAKASTTNPERINFQGVVGGVTQDLKVVPYPTAWLTVESAYQIVLAKDDFLTVKFDTCLIDDVVYAWAGGYKMKVNM